MPQTKPQGPRRDEDAFPLELGIFAKRIGLAIAGGLVALGLVLAACSFEDPNMMSRAGPPSPADAPALAEVPRL